MYDNELLITPLKCAVVITELMSPTQLFTPAVMSPGVAKSPMMSLLLSADQSDFIKTSVL